MMNRVILVGHIGQKPFFKDTGTSKVAKFSLATNEQYTDKTGQKQNVTTWHYIICFGQLAEICDKYLDKGNLVLVEGSIQRDKYTDKNGVEKESVEIKAERVKFISTRNGTSQVAPQRIAENVSNDTDLPF